MENTTTKEANPQVLNELRNKLGSVYCELDNKLKEEGVSLEEVKKAFALKLVGLLNETLNEE